MKHKYNFYKIAVTLLLISFSFNNFAQVDISTDVEYLNNQISNCNNIDLNLNNAHYITIDIQMEKYYDDYNANNVNDVADSGTIYIKLAARGTIINLETISINANDWNTNSSLTKDVVNKSRPVTIYNVDLDDYENGKLFVTYEQGSVGYGDTSPCPHTITRPHYNLSPSNTTVSCGSTNSKYFSVGSTNNSPGTLQYYWSVGSGWKNSNGDVIINDFWGNSNISIVPYEFPPSNVHVTPYLDGVPYEQLTSNVSLGDFNTNNQIVGNGSVCSTENYYLQNALPNGWSVIWSINNTSIASITQNGNNATVTRNTNQSGDVTIIATFTNSCNQTVSKTLDVFVGHQPVNLKGITGDEEICSNETKTYHINIPTCIGDVNWTISPNLHIINQGYDFITVEKNYNSTSNFGYVNVNIPDLNIHLEKIIFVGVPLNSEELFIQKISSYDLSSYRWTKFKVHPMINFDDIQESLHFEWQIPNSQVRHFTDTSIIDIKPNSLGFLNIGVRACNDCGCGDWKYRAYNVVSAPDNGNGNNSSEIVRPK